LSNRREGATETALSAYGLPDDMHANIRQLAEYWLQIHPNDGLPGRQHFDPIDVKRMLADLWLVDVVGRPPRYRYRLVGTQMVEYLGLEPTGRGLMRYSLILAIPPHFAISRVSSTRPGRAGVAGRRLCVTRRSSEPWNAYSFRLQRTDATSTLC